MHQILINPYKMSDSRVEPEREGSDIHQIWAGREISGADDDGGDDGGGGVDDEMMVSITYDMTLWL